ncbi:MAG TPA: protein phosphatase 2C domain-containing protein [Accumulibacter sp.]|jgi:protein phosphatase|nr:protein phosphatase 2C domain-containing protein [Accumulibacter sp.]HQC81452.1 protein phosphatase 2C domain-containing protein [Accumulibacter sp.]
MDYTSVDYSILAFMATDIGCLRRSNQDRVAFVVPQDAEERKRLGVLAVLADGMGGHQGGEVASDLAVKTICERYFATSGNGSRRALELAIEEANGAVFRAAQSDPRLEGMGTTATVLLLVGRKVLFANVGDSRLYRCVAGQCTQMTVDDTLVEQLLRAGIIDAEEARQHPVRNVLLRSLGTQDQLGVDARRGGSPTVGESFVLCSDGLYETIGPEEIARAVTDREPEVACRELIELARERGGRDNISVGVVAIRPLATPVRAGRWG